MKRTDGQLFRIVGFTADGKGVELQGIVQPVELYVLREQLRREFVTLVAGAR